MAPKTDQLAPEKVLATMVSLALVSLVAYGLTGRKLLVLMAAMLLLTGLLAPAIASHLATWWLRLAHFIGVINSRLLLFIIYYLLLTPIAMLYRWRHPDPLGIRKSRGDSYYCERNHLFTSSDLEKMW